MIDGRPARGPSARWLRRIDRLLVSRGERREAELERRLRELPTPSRANTVAVVSPKGGVSKTTSTFIVGGLLADRARLRTVAVDADPDFGTLASLAPAQLVFSSGGDLVSVAPDGSGRTALPPPPAGHEDSDPTWSPDGATLAFIRGEVADEDELRGTRLMLSAPDGSGAATLLGGTRGFYFSPSWSPDGASLAVARTTLGGYSAVSEILVVGRDGTGERAVARVRTGPRDRPVFLWEPAWSPDGGTIAYTRFRLDRRYDYRPDLRAVGRDGRGDRLLARDGAGADWSPDGSRIAFVSVRDRNGKRCGSDQCMYAAELYVMDAAGGGQIRLTRGKGYEQSPDWSPDGNWIAFSSDRNYPAGEHPEIYSIRADGACLSWLTNGNADSVSPAWRPLPGASGDPGACGGLAAPRMRKRGPAAGERTPPSPRHHSSPSGQSPCIENTGGAPTRPVNPARRRTARAIYLGGRYFAVFEF